MRNISTFKNSAKVSSLTLSNNFGANSTRRLPVRIGTTSESFSTKSWLQYVAKSSGSVKNHLSPIFLIRSKVVILYRLIRIFTDYVVITSLIMTLPSSRLNGLHKCHNFAVQLATFCDNKRHSLRINSRRISIREMSLCFTDFFPRQIVEIRIEICRNLFGIAFLVIFRLDKSEKRLVHGGKFRRAAFFEHAFLL